MFGPKPFLAAPGEAPMQRNADDMHGLAVADQRLDALGHHRLGVDRAALGPDPHPAALDDALLLRELLRDLDEEFRLQDGIDWSHAWSRSGSARSGGRRSPHRGTPAMPASANCAKSPLNTRATGIAADIGGDRIGDRRFERLVMRRERPVAHHAPREQARRRLPGS